MSAPHDETRAGRRRAWHLARIAAGDDPRHRVGAATEFLRAVLGDLPPEVAAMMAEEFVAQTLYLVDTVRAEHDGVTR